VLRLVLTALAVGNMHVDALYPNGTAFACLPAPNNGTWCEIDVGATDPRLHATITPGTRYRYFGSKGSASIADAVATCARMQDGWRLAVVETREESRVLAAIEATQEGVLGKFSDKAAFWVNALSRATDTANKSSLWTHNTSCWDVAMAGSYCSGVPGEDVARKRAEQPCVVYTDYGRDGRRGTAVGQRYDACFEAGANCAQAGQVSPTKNRFFCERDPAFNPQAECVASTTKTTTTTTTATAYATGLAAAERVERLEEEVTQCMIQTRGMRCEAKVAQSEALKTCVDNHSRRTRTLRASRRTRSSCSVRVARAPMTMLEQKRKRVQVRVALQRTARRWRSPRMGASLGPDPLWPQHCSSCCSSPPPRLSSFSTPTSTASCPRQRS